MLKTPGFGAVAVALMLASASVSPACAAAKAAAPAHPARQASDLGFNALDGRVVGPANGPLYDSGGDQSLPSVGRDIGPDSSRSGVDLGGVDANGASETLPLAQFAPDPHASPGHGGSSVRDFFSRLRYGGLPEPASWALILIGFGMIGGALRGFIVANRRLIRLQAEDTD
jgi:hypothetical protein